jgi:hypothetical protein
MMAARGEDRDKDAQIHLPWARMSIFIIVV